MARGIPLCCAVLASLLLQTYANFTPDCRYLANGQIQDGVGSFAGTSAHRLVYCDDQASSATTACCAYGELCTADSICYNASSSGTDRWYVGGCNDPDYEASVCRKSCGSNSLPYIQWDLSTDLWRCCGDGGCSVGVTNKTFSAPPPTELQASTYNASSSATPTPNPASTTSQTAMSSAQTTSAGTEPTSSLSAGAKAGIAIGVVAVVAALVAFAFVAWRRRRRSVTHGNGRVHDSTRYEKAELSGEGAVDHSKSSAVEAEAHGVQEADGIAMPAEADRMNVRAELDSGWRGWEANAAER